VKTEIVYDITGSFSSAAPTISASVYQWKCYEDVLKGLHIILLSRSPYSLLRWWLR